MIALLLDAVPSSVWAALAGIAAVAGAWLAGRRGGKQAARTKAVEKRLAEIQRATEVRDENSKLSDSDVRDALDKWVRPDGE